MVDRTRSRTRPHDLPASLPLVLLSLSLACARQAGVADQETGDESTDTDTSQGDTDSEAQPCASEWDCEVGERCEEGLCTCTGCGCRWAGRPPSAEIDGGAMPEHSHLDMYNPVRCFDDSDCAPLEYCEDDTCYPTKECNDDSECRAEWADRFCVDNLCRTTPCEADSDCPSESICEFDGCRWLEVLPVCASAPTFVEIMLAPIITPDEASMLILDVDGDSADDLLVRDGDTLLVHAGQPGVSDIGPASPWPLEPGSKPRALARGDIHGDGQDELLIGLASPRGVEVVIVGAAPQTLPLVVTSEAPDQIETVDVDFDGWPDLITNTPIDDEEPDSHVIEALLGDGQGGFASTWAEDTFLYGNSFVGAYPLPFWEEDDCVRLIAATAPWGLVTESFDGLGPVYGSPTLLDRPAVDASLVRATPTRSIAIVATAEVEGQGLLARRLVDDDDWRPELIVLDPSPGAVAFVRTTVDDTRSVAIVDHGDEPAGYVEYLGQELQPSCRGTLGVTLDALDMQVGDFNGDGREDLAIASVDGSLRVWLGSP